MKNDFYFKRTLDKFGESFLHVELYKSIYDTSMLQEKGEEALKALKEKKDEGLRR